MHMIKSITLWGAKYAHVQSCRILSAFSVLLFVWISGISQHQKQLMGLRPQIVAIAPATISYSFKMVSACFPLHNALLSVSWGP